MSILNWPKQQRPREKLLSQGVEQLSDAELLAIFLRTGVKGKSAVQLATDLLQQQGGLRKLLSLSFGEFSAVKGLGMAKYTQLQAALEMTRRHLQESLMQAGPLTNSRATKQFLLAKLRDFPHEVFACLFLDNQHRVLCFERLFQGSIDNATVHPRVVVQRALGHNAAAVIFAHNHPSGSPEPSTADRDMTKRLTQALELIDVRVMDHFIIADNQAVSMLELGLLP